MKLCRNCGSQVTKVDNVNKTAYCPYCDREITFEETIEDYRFKVRVAQLKAMHELMRNANDEYIYGAWIVSGVPDEPFEEDFIDIALDDEMYNECFDLFVELIEDEGNRW